MGATGPAVEENLVGQFLIFAVTLEEGAQVARHGRVVGIGQTELAQAHPAFIEQSLGKLDAGEEAVENELLHLFQAHLGGERAGQQARARAGDNDFDRLRGVIGEKRGFG